MPGWLIGQFQTTTNTVRGTQNCTQTCASLLLRTEVNQLTRTVGVPHATVPATIDTFRSYFIGQTIATVEFDNHSDCYRWVQDNVHNEYCVALGYVRNDNTGHFIVVSKINDKIYWQDPQQRQFWRCEGLLSGQDRDRAVTFYILHPQGQDELWRPTFN